MIWCRDAWEREQEELLREKEGKRDRDRYGRGVCAVYNEYATGRGKLTKYTKEQAPTCHLCRGVCGLLPRIYEHLVRRLRFRLSATLGEPRTPCNPWAPTSHQGHSLTEANPNLNKKTRPERPLLLTEPYPNPRQVHFP